MNIYVANLGFGTSESQVRDAFGTYGEVTSVQLVSQRFTDCQDSFGFVEMPNILEAEKAIKELNNSKLKNRIIVVKSWVRL